MEDRKQSYTFPKLYAVESIQFIRSKIKMIEILLVEDDQTIHNTVKYYLRQEGFSVESAMTRQTSNRKVKG